MNDWTAGFPLKIFNYELLYFEAQRDESEPSAKSSILKDLEGHRGPGDVDYAQHELTETQSNEQKSGCEKIFVDKVIPG